MQQIGPALGEVLLEALRHARDEGALARDQLAPIEASRTNRDVVGRRQRDLVQRLSGGHQNFLRHATAKRTGAADLALFHHGDRESRRPRDAGCGKTGVAGTDREHVIALGGLPGR